MLASPDVAIVGAGVGGGAIGYTLARSGLSVAILERSDRHVDRVRGEWLAPWGVAEARTLRLADALEQAGGAFLTRSVGYDETIDTATAEAGAMDCRQLHPVVDRPDVDFASDDLRRLRSNGRGGRRDAAAQRSRRRGSGRQQAGHPVRPRRHDV